MQAVVVTRNAWLSKSSLLFFALGSAGTYYVMHESEGVRMAEPQKKSLFDSALTKPDYVDSMTVTIPSHGLAHASDPRWLSENLTAQFAKAEKVMTPFAPTLFSILTGESEAYEAPATPVRDGLQIGQRIGFLNVMQKSRTEVLMGRDTRWLQVRLSISVSSVRDGSMVECRCTTGLQGRTGLLSQALVYSFVPLHLVFARMALRRATVALEHFIDAD